MTLGNKIKNLRLDKKISQKKLALILGVSQKAIDFWEKDINEPKASYIIKICKFFEVTSDYLLGLSDF
jgi:transcriptional regulator with XRE-family HTH domain